MSTSRATFSPVSSLLACTLTLLLVGCEVPVLQSLSPDNAAQGEQSVQLTLAGEKFTSGSRLVIDGSADGTGTGLTPGQLNQISPEQLTVLLHIGQNTTPGAHSIAVADTVGISAPKGFFVSCSGCPPPPRLSSLSTAGGPELFPLLRSNNSTIRLHGRNFRNNNPTVSITGAGLTFAATPAVDFDPTSQLDYIDLPITVAPDATTGRREVRVNTPGGRSNPLLLTVLAAPLVPRVTNVNVSGSTACALRPGLNDVLVTGTYFDLATHIRFQFVADGRVHDIPGANTRLNDPRTIFTQVDVGSVAPDSFSVIATGISGASAAFPVTCNPAQGPILHRISPGVVAQGTIVYVKCEGSNFSRNAQDPGADSVFWEGEGVEIEPVRPGPATADPNKVLVLKLTIADDSDPSVAIWVRNELGQFSNPATVRIMPPAAPYIQSVSPDFIHQGTSVDVTVQGTNLAPAAAIRFSSPGVTISNVVINPALESMTFTMQASPTAPLTRDEATNLLAGNPLGFRVLPPPIGPVLTKLSPARVTRGAPVFIKCEGSNFGSLRYVITDPEINGTTLFTVQANPDQVAVHLLNVPSNFPGSAISVQVQDAFDRLSNPIVLPVDDPLPGRPFLSGTDRGGEFINPVPGTSDLYVVGANLETVTPSSWRGVAGLRFLSGTASTNRASVLVDADASTPLSGDEATNITVITSAGQSNPLAVHIIP